MDTPFKGWRAVCFLTDSRGTFATFRTPGGVYCVGEIGLTDRIRWIGVFQKGSWKSIGGANHKGMVFNRKALAQLHAHTVRQMMGIVVDNPDAEAESKVAALG